jgi:hypothetical protein
MKKQGAPVAPCSLSDSKVKRRQAMRNFDDHDRTVTESEINRERYWQELRDIQSEARMDQYEDEQDALGYWRAMPVLQRVHITVLDVACAVADAIGRATLIPVPVNDSDIPF